MLHFHISTGLCPFAPLPAVCVNKLVHTMNQGRCLHLCPGINVHYIRVLKNKKQPLGYMSLYGNKFKELVCLIVRDWQDQKLVGWPACWRHRKSWCCSWSLKVSGGKILSSSGDLAVFLFILQQVEWGPPTLEGNLLYLVHQFIC